MISHTEMEHLKKLARLELTEAETNQMESDLNKLLGYFAKLSELDTEGVPEMQRPIDLVNVFREDVVGPMFSNQEAMAQAVEVDEGFFRVPRVIE